MSYSVISFLKSIKLWYGYVRCWRSFPVNILQSNICSRVAHRGPEIRLSFGQKWLRLSSTLGVSKWNLEHVATASTLSQVSAFRELNSWQFRSFFSHSIANCFKGSSPPVFKRSVGILPIPRVLLFQIHFLCTTMRQTLEISLTYECNRHTAHRRAQRTKVMYTFQCSRLSIQRFIALPRVQSLPISLGRIILE